MVLPGGEQVRAVKAPYFLATKLEAFDGRGERDYLASIDMEDIITLIDGRAEVVDEVAEAAPDIRQFLATRFGNLLQTRSFLDAVSAHLSPDAASQRRMPIVLERIRLMVQRAS